MTPDRHVGVLHARSERADPHLAPAGRRKGSVHDFEVVGTAEASHLYDSVS
jgi:hypothetical protein